MIYVTFAESFMYQVCRKFEGQMRRRKEKKKRESRETFILGFI